MQDTVRQDGKWIPAPSDLVVFQTSDHKTSAQGSLFSSIINIGALVGALCGGPLSQQIGRKGAMLFMAPLFALTWYVTSIGTGFAVLMTARLLLGVGIGLSSCVVPTYINEVSPTHLRGAFGAIFQMACVVGIMVCYLLGEVIEVNSGGHSFCQWRYLALVPLALAASLFLFALVIPESPRYLAARGKADAARMALAKLRGGAQFIGSELEEIHETIQQSSQSSGGLADLWQEKLAFGIGLTLMFIQQFSGVNAVIFFQNTIFMDAGFENAASLGFLVMLVQVIMTAASIPLMDTAGRKVLLLIACCGMTLCCAGMVIFFVFSGPSWIALVSSFLYIAFFSLGLGPIPWLMMGEIFPGKIRTSASSFAAALNWTCSFITTETISGLQALIGFGGVFGLYAVVLIFGAVFVATFVPETKAPHASNVRRKDSDLIA
ncbi:Tret1 [Symbiodinium natans]|uniref:Hexose transporter 1 n=1 Tax=Symbiodinium natans TaxID=878477 RepID=A0A812T4J6_9DINO|nr:Tret1 [Symbiodinium natans]